MSNNNILEKLQTEFITAFKKGDSVRKELLNRVKTDLTLISKTRDVVETDLVTAWKKIEKQTNATIDTCPKERSDILNQADLELSIIKEYLPKQLDELEVVELVKNYVKSNSEKNIGKIMGHFSKELKGKFDMGKLKNILDSVLII